MSKFHRLKHTFTSGELSPRLGSRLDFERYKNGCKKLRNMTCQVQGPVVRRPGMRFVFDMASISMDFTDVHFRIIPFIFSEELAYALIFFKHTDGTARMVVGINDGLVMKNGNVVALTMPANFNIDEFDYAQSLDEMNIVQPNMRPIVVIRHAHDDWAHATQTFACFPAEWPHDPVDSVKPTEADYDAVENWPETITFHQQRVVYGGNKKHPQTVWTSVAGAYLNMGALEGTDCSGVKDADHITFRLDSGTQNRIKWLLSSKVLGIGTVGNEWTVQGNQQASMAPQSLLAQRQTNLGSEKIKPLMVGIATLFVERFGRTVNEFKYEYTTDSYETSDRSVLATHFTNYYSIVDWTFQQMPDQVVWMVREDGKLLGCTYQREHKVVGWHLHDTQGKFLAATCIPGSQRADEVWALVERKVNGSDTIYLERMGYEFLGETAKEGRFLDSYIVKAPVGAVVSGLDHLEGMEVDIMADGTAHPAQVVSGGEVTLNTENYSVAVIGLQYVSEVRPYLADPGLTSGTMKGRVQKVSHVEIDFYKTLGGYVGRVDSEDGETEEELPFRKPIDNMGEEVPLFTGIYHFTFLEGFDRDVDYFIRQKQPFPMTVRGVVDIMEVT